MTGAAKKGRGRLQRVAAGFGKRGSLVFDPGQGGNKYSAKRTADCPHCGKSHDSKAEAKRCGQLHLLQRIGQISGLTVQPHFDFVVNGTPLRHENGREAGYTADFLYMEKRPDLPPLPVVEDVKGFAARDWPLRKALFRHLFPHIEFREITT